MSDYIEQSWKRFEAAVLPRDASDVQRSEMRISFFGGASVLFTMLLNQPDDEDVGARLMSDINAELAAFDDELGRAAFEILASKAKGQT